jgi:hypothetical protein
MSATSRKLLAGCAVAACCAAAPLALAQDLYDTTVLRTIEITFHDINWLTLLEQNYSSQTNILADLEIEGTIYPDVGVRIRGNTSYVGLPPSSLKFSLNVEVDFVHPDQDVMGHTTLNLNNGWRDPTFCREVVYNNYVAQFIPNPRANHVVLTLNGENWGVYINVQQFDKQMLGETFPEAGGLRIKCANIPNGPGLRYNGPDPSGYTDYEIKDDGGLADPWGALIDVCDVVTNEPLGTWPNIDLLFAIDPSIWSVVLENILTDDDSYIHKGADFMTYRNPVDGRMFLLQTDANETFTRATWSPTLSFIAPDKPVLNHVLAVPELRQRYMAHYRTVMADLSWDHFEPIFYAHRDLIDAAVQADTKKLYSYELFLANFTSNVNLPYPGMPGGPMIGLEPFINQRETYLGGNSELMASAPAIDSLRVSDGSPDPVDPVTIEAWVRPDGSTIAGVELFYRTGPGEVYERTSMAPAGSDRYSVVLPVTAVAGQRVAYYVGATASNVYESSSFYPVRSEWDPLSIEYSFGGSGMRITEWMYSGASGEFVELTNTTQDPIDMTGWSFDDDHVTAGAFDLSPFGTVQPGESVVLTESVAESFRAAWGLEASVKIIGGLGVTGGNNIGRNDELNLYDAGGVQADRLTYGDQTFPGTIRTQEASGQTCCQAIGRNDIDAWQLSELGDLFGSFAATTGEVGTPGSVDWSGCEGCGATGVAVSAPHHPIGAWLAPVRPNPFSTSSEVRFGLERQSVASLVIYDATGRQVRSLAAGSFGPGEHTVVWDGADDAGRAAPVGIYFARLKAGDDLADRKLVRIR